MLLSQNQKWSVGGIFLLVLFVTLIHRIQHPPTQGTFTLPSFSSIVSLTKGKITKAPTIPNIVHFVHLARGSDSEPDVKILFRQFVAIYSAHYYLRPGKIYIHTNIEDHVLGAAINASTDPYLRALSRLPNVAFNYERPPLKTTGGKDIQDLVHRSDFVRSRVLKKWGGLYLDDDAYVVRDLKPFRDSGFKTIAGRQKGGQISNAVMMAAPQSDVISIFDTLQDRLFEGEGTKHSIDLLSRLARDFSGVDEEMLILEQEAFYRIGADKEDLLALYHNYKKSKTARLLMDKSNGADIKRDVTGPEDKGDPVITSDEIRDMARYIEGFQDDEKNKKEKDGIDWRGSYVIHGWNTKLNEYNDTDNAMFGSKKGITLDYIMAKKSRFASVVYPALKHAVDNRVVHAHELSTSSSFNDDS